MNEMVKVGGSLIRGQPKKTECCKQKRPEKRKISKDLEFVTEYLGQLHEIE